MMIMLVATVICCLQSADAFPNNLFCKGPTVIRTSSRESFAPVNHFSSKTRLSMAKEEKYQNKVAELLSNFLPNTDKTNFNDDPDPFAGIDFNAPKYQWNRNMEALAQTLDAELIEKEWFVTGKVNPIFFADDFQFSDPDVSVDGIEGTYQRCSARLAKLRFSSYRNMHRSCLCLFLTHAILYIACQHSAVQTMPGVSTRSLIKKHRELKSFPQWSIPPSPTLSPAHGDYQER